MFDILVINLINVIIMAHNIYAERFINVIDSLNITDYKLANMIDMLHPNLSRVRSGSSGVSLRILNNLCLAFPNINADYLLNGRGGMFITDNAGQKVECNTDDAFDIINRLQASIEDKDKRIKELTDKLLNL